MENEGNQRSPGTIWKPVQTYTMATVCLIIGVLVGYLVRGSASPKPAVAAAPVVAQEASDPHAAMGNKAMPSLEEMKQMADKQAEPLLAKLKKGPQ